MNLNNKKMKSLCLNMIVKNESHIICDTLTKLLLKVKFDYYVICDTGSTDNTINIISEFFKNKDIPGEIHSHTWKDFGYNRTIALKAAFNKSDYLFIFDADDSIEGNFTLPDLTLDSYMLKFGSRENVYERMCLVKNDIIWKYIGVLHEYITAVDYEPSKGYVTGDYYIVSGRTSSRNNDPEKYLKDALILEKGYYSAIESQDSISNRYVYYCANSYLDAGNHEKAEEWYKRTLESQGWFDERYNACLKLYDLTKKMDYLVESYHHNPRRVEGIFYLIRHYTCECKYSIAMGYFNFIRWYYLNEYLSDDLSTKLFANVMDYTFYLPYYMIIVCEKVKDYSTGIKMFDIIFEKKTTAGQWWSDNLFFNLQFFDYPDISKIKEYSNYLRSIGIKVNGFKEDPKETVDILFYTGFAKEPWNYTYSLSNALGGSERAVIYLSNILSSDFSIVICGDLIDETIGNIRYINRFRLPQNIHFNTVIVSRYVSFFTIYPNLSYSKVILMAHDTHFMNNLSGCNRSANEIISSSKIDSVVYLTEWQKNHYQEESHPELKNVPFKIINNGIQPDLFPKKYEKIKNTFVYTSGSFRGLERLLELWPEILEKLPDAKLYVSSYEDFPKETELDQKLFKIINESSSVKHLGKLNQKQLYNLMDISEYWLYPCSFCETSCITALEMLMSKVICLYYPIAGLTDTLGDYGIKISHGTEVKSLMELSESQKESLKESGVRYSVQCSWESQAKLWKSHFFKKRLLFYAKDDFPKIVLEDYLQSLAQNFEVTYTTKIENVNFDELIFVHEAFDPTVFDSFKVVSYLNTEPLNLECRLSYVIGNVNKNEKYSRLKWYYDYSLSNIKILNDNSISNTFYLPYLTSESEIKRLKKLLEGPKEYDYGIVCSASVFTKDPSKLEPIRRRKVVEYLLEQGFTVNLIYGFGESRDLELSKCKTILNIHGQYCETPTTIFEHIRCNRLLDSGFNILSETSQHLDPNFIKKYSNLKFIDYPGFFQIKKRTIVDSFTFYNELDMLEYRLNVLNDYVDKFILVESVCTFVGHPKELYYQLNKERFKKFEDKIIHVVVDDPPYSLNENKQWENEKHQRNAIERGFVDLEDSDIIILGDLDEIPSESVLNSLRFNGIQGIAQLEQEFYYYNFNSKMDHLWYFQKVINYSYYLKINGSLHDIRMSGWETIPNGGWHLSYFGNSEFISNKIKNFSHQEYNNPHFTEPELIKNRITSGIDLFERGNKIIQTTPFENVLPRNWKTLSSFYKKPKIHCFISSCNTRGTKRLDHLLQEIKKIEFHSVNIINIGPELEYQGVENYSKNPELFEIPTLNKIISFSEQNPGDFVLYVHTKGVSHSDTYHELNDWIDMMLYFLIDSFAIEMLYSFETVGCNFNEKPHPHFSGNFWWARTDYLKKLKSIPEINVDRNSGEYLLHSMNPSYYSLHNSNVNHYHSRYQKNRYQFLK